MPNITNPGSLFYPSGGQTASVLGPNQVVTLTSADINTPRTVFASGWGATVQMPNVSGAPYTPGQTNFVIFVRPDSYPVLLRNGGVQGQEATLEAIIPPGMRSDNQMLASGAGNQFGQAYSAAAGFWGRTFQGDSINPTESKMLAKLQYGTQDLFFTASSNIGVGSSSTVALSSGLGVFVFSDTFNNIKGVPIQISAAGVAAIGVETQIAANGGSTLQYAMVSKATAATALVSWWDNTNKKNGFCVITLASGVSVPTLSVGSSADDTGTVPASGNRINLPGFYGSDLVANNAGAGPNHWLCGLTAAGGGMGRVRAYYITVSGTVPAVTASLDYDPAGTVDRQFAGFRGYSPSNNNLLVQGNTGGQLLYSLTFAAGSITSGANTVTTFPTSSNGMISRVDPVNAAASIYNCMKGGTLVGGTGGVGPVFSVGKFSITSSGVSEIEGITTTGLAVGSIIQFQPLLTTVLGEGEYFGYNPPNTSPTYVDFRNLYPTGQAAGQVIPLQTSYTLWGSMFGVCCDQVTRRVILISAVGAGTAQFTFYESPKR